MKTTITILATLAFAASVFTACSDDDRQEPVAAVITAGIGELQTRAAWAKDDAIGVTATTGDIDYTNVKYLTTDGNARFTAAVPGSEIYFESDKAVVFTAYYPYTGNNGAAPAVITKTITAADQTPEAQPAVDYLFGTGSGSQADPVVKLQFTHSMSLVVLKFLPGNGFDRLPALGCTLDGLLLSGTFDPATGQALATEGSAPAPIAIPEVPAADTGSGAPVQSATLILFPQPTTSATVTVTAGGVKYQAALAFPADGDKREAGLVPGVAYTFNVTVSKQGLSVDKAIITDWDYSHSDDIDATL